MCGGLPDRETYLSARVLLASSFEFAGALELPSMRATEYLPPTREYFDRVLGELEALRAARDWLEELGAAVPLESAGAAVTQIAGVLPMAERPISRLLADPAYPAPAPVAPTLDDDQDTGEGDRRMKLEPMANQIVGRIVRAAAHKSGIVMPDSDRTKGESVFVKVDCVGPDVRRAKPGRSSCTASASTSGSATACTSCL